MIASMAFRTVTLVLAAFVFTWLRPLLAQSASDTERLEKLERAVEPLQNRNAELEDEVQSLKKRLAFAPEVDANGNQQSKAAPDGKTLLEKPIVTEEKPP